MNKNNLRKILYMEDSADFQQVVELSLGDLGGYEVKVCGSGAEVLESAESFNPDLFLLDIFVPDTTGPELLKKLRKIPMFQNTPTIFISSGFSSEELMGFEELGVIGIVRKPFDPITLPETISCLYEGNHLNQEYLELSKEDEEDRPYIIE